jgi:hypothetical protein
MEKHMSNRVSIVVHGIDDASILAQCEGAIQEAFSELALPGLWQVFVRPSRVGGQWAFSVHGLDVRHNLSFAVPACLLPSLIPPRLSESLNRIVSTKVKTAATRARTRMLRAV